MIVLSPRLALSVLTMTDETNRDAESETARRNEPWNGAPPKQHPSDHAEAVYSLMHDHADAYLTLTELVQHETTRKVLAMLSVNQSSVRMQELYAAANVSDRTVRKHVNKLEDNHLIERTRHPTAIKPVSDDIDVLISEVVSLAYDSF